MPAARIVLYAATAAVLVLVCRSFLLGPPPLYVSALAFASYTGLLLTGVFALRLRMFADAIVRGPKGSRGVVLTFDDGPDPRSTPLVLDALDAARAKATFFVIARKAEEHPDLVREILRRGHEIGLHSYAHDRLFAMRSEAAVRADILRGVEVLGRITGRRPTIFRPPIGHTNPRIARVVDALDLTMVGWSVSARDGLPGARLERVLARLRSKLEHGAIVLLHDAAERGDHVPVGARALPALLDTVRDARLDVVPLAGWLAGESSMSAPGEPTPS
jgi:peptidoglycan/xylan/chitin deacetylase (PgdA/CDA1 family)